MKYTFWEIWWSVSLAALTSWQLLSLDAAQGTCSLWAEALNVRRDLPPAEESVLRRLISIKNLIERHSPRAITIILTAEICGTDVVIYDEILGYPPQSGYEELSHYFSTIFWHFLFWLQSQTLRYLNASAF